MTLMQICDGCCDFSSPASAEGAFIVRARSGQSAPLSSPRGDVALSVALLRFWAILLAQQHCSFEVLEGASFAFPFRFRRSRCAVFDMALSVALLRFWALLLAQQHYSFEALEGASFAFPLADMSYRCSCFMPYLHSSCLF